MCKFDFVFDIIFLQYYSINTLLNGFYSRQRIITNFFWDGRNLQMFCRDLMWSSGLYDRKKCLAPNIGVTLYVYKEKTNTQYGYALRIGTAPVGLN